MKITCPQIKKSCEALVGENLLSTLVRNGIPLAHSCAGRGMCGACEVKLQGDGLPPRSEKELRLLKLRQMSVESPKRFACLVQIPQLSKLWMLESDYW